MFHVIRCSRYGWGRALAKDIEKGPMAMVDGFVLVCKANRQEKKAIAVVDKGAVIFFLWLNSGWGSRREVPDIEISNSQFNRQQHGCVL